ncbi:TPA: ORF6N domain-containing protein [Escherichia coli]|uniref:ORF6N domain-containing protein n=1 Tax=Escherichia coli TaxID=562 RepID=UPI00098BE79B|nr:ORF6N domain-containing protein [Escherichia coli]EFA4178455.1 ORF6N domain-containing protein [Escherichia coli O43:H14]EES3413050.1 ORF6N domain-containing protein [Escherichia coli]EET8026001.1 ORF6N domain-containing protein [Escherichia coli]EET9412698.1 ORF6N domain-containing protein [Escherichia coli]EEV1306937.1 ORF6N domain-containing protein [Escherichia coli]
MMINKQKLVNPENLPVIEWQGVRVVTTETLAAGYGTTPIRIQQNYIRNEDRFVEGKHFFKISGDELKSFRLSFSESVNKHTTSLVLWTERGAARMSKIVDTDEAWLFFEKMEQAYFRKATPSSNTIPDFDDPIAAAEAWIEAKKSERLALGYAERQARYISKLESHLADGITPVQFCKQLNGVNTRQINAFLEERNWLYDDRPEAMYPRWRVKAYARDQYLTERSGQVEQENGEMREIFKPLLKKKGAAWLYRHYLNGELPMKKTWDGLFTHNTELANLLQENK